MTSYVTFLALIANGNMLGPNKLTPSFCSRPQFYWLGPLWQTNNKQKEHNNSVEYSTNFVNCLTLSSKMQKNCMQTALVAAENDFKLQTRPTAMLAPRFVDRTDRTGAAVSVDDIQTSQQYQDIWACDQGRMAETCYAWGMNIENKLPIQRSEKINKPSWLTISILCQMVVGGAGGKMKRKKWMHPEQGKLFVKKVSLNTRLTFNHMGNLRSSILEYLTFGHQISDILILVAKQILQRKFFLM